MKRTSSCALNSTPILDAQSGAARANQVHICNDCSAINNAARIGPIEGVWRSSLLALCFLLLVNRSGLTAWRNALRVSSRW